MTRKVPQYFRPVGWEKLQTYKRSHPKYIKLEVALLDNYEYAQLTLSQRAILVGIWQLYARRDGPIPVDTRFIGESLSCDTRAVSKAYPVLLSNNFIELCDQFAGASRARVESETKEESLRESSDSLRDSSSKESNDSFLAFCGSQGDPPNAPVLNDSKYAFEGVVIRLTADDLRRWEEGFPRLDVRAQLTALDAWYADQGITKNWFARCASALAKRNAEVADDAQPKSAMQLAREAMI